MNKREVLPYGFFLVDNHAIESRSFKEKNTLSGNMKVNLIVKSPLIAIEENYIGKRKRNNTELKDLSKIIPGSSIKGMVRSLAEVVWNGKVSILHKDIENLRIIPKAWKISDSTINSHCPVSHLFGFVSGEVGEDQKNKEHIENAYGSRLIFSDAHVKTSNEIGGYGIIPKNTLNTPVGRGKITEILRTRSYLNGNTLKGRKLYLAGRLKNNEKRIYLEPNSKYLFQDHKGWFIDKQPNYDPHNKEVYVIAPNSIYEFIIKFKNIAEKDLVELIHILELEEGKYHALGKGKPLGYGRVQLTVEKIVYHTKNYYLQLDESEKLPEIDDLRRQGSKYKNNYVKVYPFLDETIFDKLKTYGTKDNVPEPYVASDRDSSQNTVVKNEGNKIKNNMQSNTQLSTDKSKGGKYVNNKPVSTDIKHAKHNRKNSSFENRSSFGATIGDAIKAKQETFQDKKK